MQARLDALKVPYGAILDVDNINNIDKLLEPFMRELDLQGLYMDYPILKSPQLKAHSLHISRQALTDIMHDSRLIPVITSLNAGDIFSRGMDHCLPRKPAKQDGKEPRVWYDRILAYYKRLDLFWIGSLCLKRRLCKYNKDLKK